MAKHSKEELEAIVKESFSKAECLRKLNLRPAGANYKWLDKMIKKFDLNISHFTGKGWSFGKQLGISNRSKPLCEILVENSDYSNSNALKKRLLKEGKKEYKCEKCLNATWNELPIPLELEHSNGINTDNRIENLKLLCPNCHAQTPHYRGKNKLSSLNERRELNRVKFGETCKMAIPRQADEEIHRASVETKRHEPKAIKKCQCGKEINHKSVKCRECDYLERKTSRPSYNQLIQDFQNLKSFSLVGKKYGVSDNSVRKWVKLYQIDVDEAKVKI
jgi:Zn finger protein HypA/HybF involved in hydrogenase expression